MLQEIAAGYRWELPPDDDYPGRYFCVLDGDGIIVVGEDGSNWDRLRLPPGVVLAQEVDAPAPADPFAELETWGCPECAGTGRNEYWLKCHLCHGHGVLYRRPASA